MQPSSKEFNERIRKAVETAEKSSSGEIRVCIRDHIRGEIIENAKKQFERLGMTNTERRNGVLFFIALRDRNFAVVGDSGINELVPDDFWDEIVGKMKTYFAAGDLAAGLEAGIIQAGKALSEFFPYSRDVVNELSDEVDYDDKN